MGHRLVIGTTNAGKVRQMVGALAGTGFDCVPIVSVLDSLPTVVEIGASAAEIAERKAKAYHDAIGEVTLSLDHWLTFDEVADSEQPNGQVRRIPERPDGATDDELIEYYRSLASRHGGQLTARWALGVAVAGPNGVLSATCEAVRRLVDTPSGVRPEGLPLSALQIDLDTGRYVSEHSGDEEERLWQRVYGASTARFVERAYHLVSHGNEDAGRLTP